MKCNTSLITGKHAHRHTQIKFILFFLFLCISRQRSLIRVRDFSLVTSSLMQRFWTMHMRVVYSIRKDHTCTSMHMALLGLFEIHPAELCRYSLVSSHWVLQVQIPPKAVYFSLKITALECAFHCHSGVSIVIEYYMSQNSTLCTKL